MTDAVAKIVAAIKPLIDDAVKTLIDTLVLQVQELQVSVEALQKQNELLHKEISGAKKKVANHEPKASNTTADGAAAPAPTESKFVNNKLMYFKDMFKNDEGFRAKYFTAELAAAAAADPLIAKKTKDDQRLTATATFCWNLIKKQYPDMLTAINADFDAAKKAHEDAAKAPQCNVEPPSPNKA